MENVRNSTNTGIEADDDIPELDEAWFEEADLFVGDKLVRRGRPKAEMPKKLVSLRLDQEVIDWFKQSGAKWQTRINDELRKAAGL